MKECPTCDHKLEEPGDCSKCLTPLHWSIRRSNRGNGPIGLIKIHKSPYITRLCNAQQYDKALAEYTLYQITDGPKV